MGASTYRLLLQAKLDTTSINAQIKALTAKKVTIGVSTVGSATKELTAWEKVNKSIQQGVNSQLRFAAASALVVGSLRAISKGVEYIKELDKEMTNIQIVTGMANEEIQQLTVQYNNLAQEMGATTIEVAEGTLEWFRQGKTATEAIQLVRGSLMLSKLANMESAEATEYLTAILNGFKLEASEVVGVIDKLVAVDNVAATSAAEIAVALQRSSNSAQEAGVSFEALVAYIATVSSVTRKNAASIGEAFKTMFARLTNVKLTALSDADSAINDVEKALGLAGITVRETATEFRDMEDVLFELAGKWKDLNEVERSAISNAIAGVRQRENFIVLMNNFNEVLRLQEEEWMSTGLAANRYQIYLEGLEASSNKLRSAWEGLWQKTVDDSTVKFFTDLTTKVLKLITASGGLVPILTQVLSVLVLIYRVQIISFFTGLGNAITSLIPAATKATTGMAAQALATDTASVSFAGYTTYATSAAVATNAVSTSAKVLQASLGFIALALMAGTLLWQAFSLATKDASERIEELNQAIEQSNTRIASLRDQTVAIEGLSKSYVELSNKAELSVEEQQKLYDIGNALHDMLPQLAGSYDSMGNYILETLPPLEELIRLKQLEIEAELELLRVSAMSGLDDRSDAYSDAVDDVTFYTEQINKLQEEIDRMAEEGSLLYVEAIAARQNAINEFRKDLAQAEAEQRLATVQMQRDYSVLLDEDQPQYIANLAVMIGLTEEETKKLLEYGSALSVTTDETEKAAYSTETLALVMKSVLDEMDAINSAISKQNAGTLLYDDVVKLLEVNSAFIDDLEIIDGQIRLNTEAMNAYQVELVNETIAKERENGASAEQLALLIAYRDELDAAVPLSRDYAQSLIDMTAAARDHMHYLLDYKTQGDENNDTVTAATQKINELGAQLEATTIQYKEGKLTAEEYYQALNEDIANLNFDEVFGEDVAASQIFFTGLVQQAAAALNQLNSEWNAGNMLVSEYTDSIDDLADFFLNIGGIFQEVFMNSEDLRSGIQTTSDEFTESMGQMADSAQLLRDSQELISLTDEYFNAFKQNSLQFSKELTSDYGVAMQQIADAYANSAMSFTDLNGVAYTSADGLYNYLMQSEGNFTTFSDSIANQAGEGIQGIVVAAGGMLEALGTAIQNFDATVMFTPEQTGSAQFDVGVNLPWQKEPMKLSIDVPQFQIGISGKGGTSLAGLGESIANLGAKLKDTNLNWDSSAFIKPTMQANQATGGMGRGASKASKAFNGLRDSVKEVGGSAKEAEPSVKDLLDLVMDKIKQEKEAEKELLKQQLDGYKKIIDKRKELLKSKREEEKYNQKIQKQSDEISRIEAEMLELSLDDSEEAMARRMKLEEELAQAREDLENEQADHSVDVQTDALDKDYERFEEYIDSKIKVIEDFLSKPGEIMQEAIRIIEEKGSTLYDDLMRWNQEYGSGIDADVTSAWNDAYEAMSKFMEETGRWDVQIQMHREEESGGTKKYHSGGFVGGLESNEEFAKLLKGELVLTPEQMDNLIAQFIPLPAQPSSKLGVGGATIDNFIGSIIVQGNLDTKVVPELERVIMKGIDELNKAMTTRGYQRRATEFSI